MSELLFRALKKQPATHSSDTVAFKSYQNTHQDEVKKEVEYIQKKLLSNDLMR